MDLPKLQKRPKITFWLLKAKKGYYLKCEVNQDNHEARFSTGIKLAKKNEWDKEKGILRNSELESQRIKIVHDLNTIINNLNFQNKPLNPATIVKIYKNEGYVPTLVEIYQRYIDERMKPKYERGEIKQSVFNRYKYRLTALKKALEGLGESKKLITETNSAFFQRLEQEYCKDKGATSVRKHTEILTNVMAFAETLELISKNPINSQTFLVKAKHKENIVYLVENQLEAWTNANFIEKKFSIARDIFLLMCYTGMGYADVMAFDYSKDIFDDIDGIKRISSERVKTDTSFCVPLLPQAEAILEKYNYKMPYVRNDYLNKDLRVIAEHLGIELYLKSHIGRKTFGYLMLNVHKISIEIVAKMLGHKTVDMTLRFYAKHLDRTIIEATKHLVLGNQENR